jgi:hypothetical protein
MRGLDNIINLNIDPNFWINDIGLFVPPTSISMHKEGLNYSIKSLRTRVSTKVLSGNGIYHAQINLTFPPDGLVQLHRLICQIKNNPFVFIKNSWIQKTIDNTKSNGDVFYFTVMGLNIINHPSSIGSYNVELDLRYFNEKVYDANLRYVEDWGYDLVKNDQKQRVSFSCIEGEENIISITKQEESGNLSIREIENSLKSEAGALNPIVSFAVTEPKDSKAYVRYSNYLQSVSLEENFGIVIKNLNEYSLVKSKFEQGTEGFHSVRDNALLKFRNELIEKMLFKSSTTVFYFRSFALLKYTPEFYKYLRSIIDEGVSPEDILEKKQAKRKENFEILLKGISGEIKPEMFSSKEVVFESLKPNERNFEIPIIPETEANKYTYYPITDTPYYKRASDTNLIVGNKRKLGSDRYAIFPLFCPEDGKILVWDENLFVAKFKNDVEFKVEGMYCPMNILDRVFNLRAFERVKNGWARANIKKGTLIGFIDQEESSITTSKEIVDYYIRGVNTSSSRIEKTKTTYANDFKELKKYIDDNFSIYSGVEGLENVLEKVISEVNLDFSKEDLEAIIGREILNEEMLQYGIAEEDLKTTRHAITAVSGSLRNIISSIPILGQEYPTHQFLGSIEPEFQINIIAKDNIAVDLNIISFLEQGRANSQYYAKNFSAIPDAGNFMVECFITRLLGSYKESNKLLVEAEGETIGIFQPNFSISSLDTFTIEGSPNTTGLNFRFGESKSYREENLRPVASNKIGSDFQRKILSNLKSNNIIKINNPEATVKDNQGKPVAVEALNNGSKGYVFLNWKTKYYNSQLWYSKNTKIKTNLVNYINTEEESDLNQDFNAYQLCLCLDVLQDLLNNYSPYYNFINKPLKITLGSTFDSSDTGIRDTVSNHYHGSAADIRVNGLNAMELCGIIEILMEENYLKNPKMLLNSGLGLFGLGIYGENSYNENRVMDGSGSNGFVHIDLNAKLNKDHSAGTKSILGTYSFEEFKYGRRRWVGKSGDDRFIEDSVGHFWKTRIEQIKNEIRAKVLEAINNSKTNIPSTRPEKIFTWSQVPAFGIKNGGVSYNRNSISSEFEDKYMNAYNKIIALGGVLTSGGGRRDLSTIDKPRLGMHNIGRAIDLGAYSGLYGNINENEDTVYLVIRDNPNNEKSLYTVWCPIVKTRPDFDQAVYNAALNETGLITNQTFTVSLVKTLQNQSTYQWTGEAFNLTKILEDQGFVRIPPIDDYLTKGNFKGTEWWHYEIHDGLVVNETTALNEMLKMYTLKEAMEKHKYFDEVKDFVWSQQGYFKRRS